MDQTEIDNLFDSGATEEKKGKGAASEKTSVDAQSLEEKVAKKLESVAARKDIAPTAPGETKVVETGDITKGIDPGHRGEVSVSTLARMMGVATTNELSLLEGKIDLLATRVNGLTVRMEKVLNAISRVPTGTDLDRIDINIGSLKTMIRDTMEKLIAQAVTVETGPALDGSKIMSSENPSANGAKAASDE